MCARPRSCTCAYESTIQGNLPGQSSNWSLKPKSQSNGKMLKLTPGKGTADLAVPITDLIENAIREFDVLAFVKGCVDAVLSLSLSLSLCRCLMLDIEIDGLGQKIDAAESGRWHMWYNSS